jgi:hypothetical protein
MERAIALQDINSFNEVFETYTFDQIKKPNKLMVHTNGKDNMHIGSFCILPDKTSIWVRPTWPAFEAIKNNTIFIQNEEMFFEIIKWDEKRALILCRYNTIVGSVWLAIIDPNTIPNK